MGYLEPIDQSMCDYRIKHSTNAEGTSGLVPSNPTHLRLFVDSNGDSQLEMGFLDETTSAWIADSFSRVTINSGGIQLKTDLTWSNGGIYIASGYDNIEGCGPSNSPTLMPSSEPSTTTTLIPTAEPTSVPTNGSVKSTTTSPSSTAIENSPDAQGVLNDDSCAFALDGECDVYGAMAFCAPERTVVIVETALETLVLVHQAHRGLGV